LSSAAITPPQGSADHLSSGASTPPPSGDDFVQRLEVAIGSDKGKVRPNNEDSYVARADLGLLAIADGVGGHQAGEIASNLACSILEASVSFALLAADVTVNRFTEAMTLAFRTAGRGIVDKADSNPRFHGMGTTLVAFFLPPDGNEGIVAHVGDSRLYHCHGGQCTRITMDHTLYEELIAQGKADRLGTRLGETRNILTRALGIKREYDVDVQRLEVAVGDRFLLCTDGLTDVVTDDEIGAELATTAWTAQQIVDRLIAMALQRGGPDNVTIGIAEVIA
jgi:serine/threonine protein phosphatase PrpC